MGDMRRSTAAQARRNVIRRQGLFYGLNVDDDPRAVGDNDGDGIRYNPLHENFVPQGNKITSRRAMIRTETDVVPFEPGNRLVSQIESWDGSVLSAYASDIGLRIRSQIDTNSSGTLQLNYTIPTITPEFDAKFYRISSDKILLATNNEESGFIVIYDDNGTYNSVRVDSGATLTATVQGTSVLPSGNLNSYRYDFGFSYSAKDSAGVTISQTPMQGLSTGNNFLELRMDEKLGTAGYSLFIDVTKGASELVDYTHVQVWRTLNYSIDTGDANDDALAEEEGSRVQYYKLVEVPIADIATTDLFSYSDENIIGVEQKIQGFELAPASSLCAISEAFFITASEERAYYTALGDSSTDIGFYYRAFQYRDFDDTVNSLTLSNGWILIGTTPKTYRWDLVSTGDAGVISDGIKVGLSIPLLGEVLQASGDIGISRDRANASVVATNGHICSFCADGSVRVFDGATWSDDYTAGKIRSITINNSIVANAVAGWLPHGEYILWLGGYTLALQMPQGNYPHRWTNYSADLTITAEDRDWQTPTFTPIYLGNGNTYNKDVDVSGYSCLVIANGVNRYIWENRYPFKATTTECVIQFGELTGEQWYYFITPEETHFYLNNIDETQGTPVITAELVSRDATGVADITSIIDDAGQITLYSPVDAGTKWHSYSVIFRVTGGDIVINKLDGIAEVMDKNNFPTKEIYKPTIITKKFRTPTIQILTGDGPLMTATKNPTDAVYGLLQGENGEVISSPNAIISAGCSVVANDPFGGTNKSVHVVGATQLLGKNSGNPLSRPTSIGSRRGLFVPSGSYLDDKTLVLGENSGWNPVYEGRTMVSWWQKKTSTFDSIGDTAIFGFGDGYSLVQKVRVVGESKEFAIVSNTPGQYLRAPLIDDRDFVVDEWEYYIVEAMRTDNGDGSFDDNYKLYRGFANDPTLVLVDELLFANVINTTGPFYFTSNSITFNGTVDHSYFDICLFSGLTNETPQELWSVKYNLDEADWVYNAGNNPNADNGN